MQHIEIFQDDRAKYYDEFVKIWIVNYSFVLKALPALIDLKPNKKENILVVGCGTGNEIKAISEHSPNLKITGVDPSVEMMAIAKQKLSHLDNVNLILGTTDNLDSNIKFGAASLLLVLHFMNGHGAKLDILRGISERLVPKAPLIILDIFGDEEEFDFNRLFLEQLLPKELHGINIPERIASMPERVFPISEERLDELLAETGFTRPIRFFQSAIYGGWICFKR